MQHFQIQDFEASSPIPWTNITNKLYSLTLLLQFESSFKYIIINTNIISFFWSKSPNNYQTHLNRIKFLTIFADPIYLTFAQPHL